MFMVKKYATLDELIKKKDLLIEIKIKVSSEGVCAKCSIFSPKKEFTRKWKTQKNISDELLNIKKIIPKMWYAHELFEILQIPSWLKPTTESYN